MTEENIKRMAKEAGFSDSEVDYIQSIIIHFATLVAQQEREACEALHDHEDVQAPVGNSSWGEAYQEGWGQGTAAYLEAIRARAKHD